jgi:hypothetical protein
MTTHKESLFDQQVRAVIGLGMTPRALELAFHDGREEVRELADRFQVRPAFLRRVAVRWGVLDKEPDPSPERIPGGLGRDRLSLVPKLG